MADPYQPITKSKLAPPSKRWLWLSLGIVLLALLALPAYWGLRSYRYEQQLEQAYAELKQGATAQANFHLRVLVANYAEDDRTYAALSKYASLLNRPEAIAWLEKAIELNPKKVDYRVALVLALLQFNQLAAAQQSLATWPEAQRTTIAYPQAQAAVAFARGHWQTAAPYLEEIIELEGPTPLHVNNLAKAQLHASDPLIATEARRTLETQLTDPRLAWQAGQSLVQDALRRGDVAQAQAYLTQLRARPRTAVEQDLLLLEAGTPLGPTYLDQRQADLAAAQARWQGTPDAAARLIGWMATHGLSVEAIEWSQTFEPVLQEEFPVAFAVGEARLKLNRSDDVLAAYEGKSWSRHDEQRHLLLARATALQTPTLSAADNLHLQRALEIAAREEFGLVNLERILQTWRWPAALEPVWWRLLEKRQQVPRALLGLYQWYEYQQDYAKLLEVAQFELGLDPQNVAAANNVAYLSLLLGQNREQALRLAQDFQQRYPTQASLKSTYALALLEQGEAERAHALLMSLPAPQLQKASNQLLLARIQAAQGHSEQALSTLQAIDPKQLIAPERVQFLALQEKLSTLAQPGQNP